MNGSATSTGSATVHGRDQRLVMVVEDDFALRELLADILRREGYRVIHTADGRDALEQFSRNAPIVDLVIADLQLPTFGGIELIEAMRGIGGRPRFLICSGLVNPEVRARLTAAGITDYIMKPFTIGEFIDKIARLLRR